jgi:glc operon protein GlcG
MNQKPVLPAETARRMLDAATEAAHAEELSVSVAVVDDGGYLICLQRMDGAGLMTAQVAIDKARTAALTRASSRRLAERVAAEPALLRLTDYLPLAGGLPAMHDGRCAGAVGVSGGTADQDELVARAALAILPTYGS